MAEWEDRMQKILNDPGAMAQIMQMAQQLSGSSVPTPPPAPTSAPPPSPAALPLDGDTLTLNLWNGMALTFEKAN